MWKRQPHLAFSCKVFSSFLRREKRSRGGAVTHISPWPLPGGSRAGGLWVALILESPWLTITIQRGDRTVRAQTWKQRGKLRPVWFSHREREQGLWAGLGWRHGSDQAGSPLDRGGSGPPLALHLLAVHRSVWGSCSLCTQQCQEPFPFPKEAFEEGCRRGRTGGCCPHVCPHLRKQIPQHALTTPKAGGRNCARPASQLNRGEGQPRPRQRWREGAWGSLQ